jgi:hypothetical protein
LKNGLILIAIIAALAVAWGATPARAADASDKEALAEKQGDALKMERAAELDAMREFENVTPTLAVAVKSCALVPVEKPKKKDGDKGESVDLGGGDWGALAGSLFRTVEREIREDHDETPPDRATPADGKVYVRLNVEVKNLSTKTQLILPGDFTLQSPEGYTVNYNVKTFGAVDYFDGIYLPAGATSGGTLFFVLQPRDEYTLYYYNPVTKAGGTKKVHVMRGD